MPLSSSLNTTYRPSSVNVTEKYTPLLDVKVAKSDTAVVQRIAQDRIDTFATIGVGTNRLIYLTQDINTIIQRETDNDPPLVVVSSNRSTWINSGYIKATTILKSLGKKYFTDVNDVQALREGAVPFYLPVRLGEAAAKKRTVYMFVAAEEANKYRIAVGGSGIIVVGWKTVGNYQLAGFGASRYAALEFFKYLYRTHNICSKIWMLDDNVSYINTFAGLTAIEGELKETYGMGFSGATQVSPDSEFKSMSVKVVRPPVAVTAHRDAPILQQAVLWNVAKLNTLGITFSPYFITSAEDTSLTKYLNNLDKVNCQYYKGCEILKGNTVPYDNTPQVKVVQIYKNILLNFCFRAKTDVPFTSTDVPNATTLEGIIDAARDDPKKPPRISDVKDQETGDQTYSKAVEQTLSAGLAEGIKLPAGIFTPGVLNITFKTVHY